MPHKNQSYVSIKSNSCRITGILYISARELVGSERICNLEVGLTSLRRWLRSLHLVVSCLTQHRDRQEGRRRRNEAAIVSRSKSELQLNDPAVPDHLYIKWIPSDNILSGFYIFWCRYLSKDARATVIPFPRVSTFLFRRACISSSYCGAKGLWAEYSDVELVRRVVRFRYLYQ